MNTSKRILISIVIGVIAVSALFFLLYNSYNLRNFNYSLVSLSDSTIALISEENINDTVFIATPYYSRYTAFYKGKIVAYNYINVVYNYTVKGKIIVSDEIRKLKCLLQKGDTVIFKLKEKYDKDRFKQEFKFYFQQELNNYSKQTFYESNLPILFLNTLKKSITRQKEVSEYALFMPKNGKTDFIFSKPYKKGKLEIKVRGETSASFPKKQYGIYFLSPDGKRKKIKIPGLPKDDEFVLYGPFVDVSGFRNVLVYRLYREMGHFASHTKFIELVINNDYRGLYVIIEKIKKNKLHLNGCDSLCTKNFIVKIDKPKEGWWEKGCFRFKNNDFITEDGDRGIHYYLMTVFPKYSKGKKCAGKIAKYFESISKSISHKDSLVYDSLIYFKTFIDFSIINELSKNVDAYRISTYFYRKDASKLRAGPPWDYNFSFGNVDIEGGLNSQGFMFDNPITLFWWRFLFHNDEKYKKSYMKRWSKLRTTVLSYSNLENIIGNYYLMLKKPMKRDYEKWKQYDNNNFFRKEEVYSYKDEIKYFTNWLKRRIEFLDNELEK